MPFGIIYVVTNLVNGKQYVGQTRYSLDTRWRYHSRCIRKNYGGALYSAVRKYGFDAFTVEQIDSAETLDELNVLEARYIAELQTFAPNGYNMTTGGEGHLVCDATRQKISKACKGRVVSEETRQKLSDASKNRTVSWTLSKETRKRMSESHIGLAKSKETRQKLSRANTKLLCKKGHPFDEANTLVNKKTGGRTCWTCHCLRSLCCIPPRLLVYCSEEEFTKHAEKLKAHKASVATTRENRRIACCKYKHAFVGANVHPRRRGFCLVCHYLRGSSKISEKLLPYCSEQELTEHAEKLKLHKEEVRLRRIARRVA